PQPREPEPGADGLKEDDSLRVALSIMLWQNWSQVPVFNADGQETGTITRDRIIQEGA
ncbi:MAG TPA: ABC transporter, partial [Marinobacter adhaerens]|nr:ABC transporter [Marinobacter adhaerens]